MPNKKHIHKYHRVEVNGIPVWACALPDCSHHMPKHYEGMVIGKYSICWTCESKFMLDTENMKEDRPRCHNCTSGINPDSIDVLINQA